MLVKRGEIYYARLDGAEGSEQGGIRPVLVVQNDVGNKFSTTIQVAPITSRFKKEMKTHLYISSAKSGLRCDSVAMMEQIRTIDKCRLGQFVGKIDLDTEEDKINTAIMISFGIPFYRSHSDSTFAMQS